MGYVGDTAAADPGMPMHLLVDGQKRTEGRVAVTPRDPFHHCRFRPPPDMAKAPTHPKRTSKYAWTRSGLTEPCMVPITQRLTSENTRWTAGSTSCACRPAAAIEVPRCSYRSRVAAAGLQAHEV